LFTSDKLKEEKVPEWISDYIRGKGYSCETNAQWMLLDFLGNDLSRLSNELDKLILLLPQGQKTITGVQVEQNIGMSKDFNTFELTRAFTKHDVLKANRIINYFAKNPRNNPALAVIGMLFYYFTRVLLYHSCKDKSKDKLATQLGLSPYFITEYQQAAGVFSFSKTCDIIGLLREYDLKLKGMDSTAADKELMRELVYKILH
jgi:DNA polymerase-3 subunit delta